MANKIQIKRSVANATVTGLSAGELAFTQASNTLFVGLPDGSGVLRIGGAMVPGTLTANQALVANSTSGIDKVIVANLVPTTIWANGSSGSAGQLLTTNGSVAYWSTPAPSVVGSNTEVQFNDGGALGADSGLTFNKTTDTLSTNTVLATSTVNAATLSVGTSVVANSSRLVIGTFVGLDANGSIGNAGQVLHSNGSTVYWANTVADITSVSAGDGLTGGGNSGDLTLTVVAGANGGLVSNSTGVWITAGNGLFTDSSGLNIGAGNGISVSADSFRVQQANGIIVNSGGVTIDAANGLVANTTGLHVGSGNGVAVDADSVRVVAGTGVTVNATGVHIGQAVETTSNVTFSNVVTSNLSVTGTVSSNVIPVANLTYHLGNTTNRWAQVHGGNGHFVTGTFDGNVNVGGDLVVTGNVTTVNVNSVVVSDPMIYLAGNNYSSDLVDIGFAANYNDGTNRHTGLFRDHTDGVWKLFTNLTQELSGNNDVDTSEASYRTAILNAYLLSSGLTTNSSVVDITANSSVTVSIVANTLTLSSPLAGTSGGTGKSTMTSEAILVGNTSNGYRELTLGTAGYVLQSNGSALVYDILDGGTF